MSENVGILKFEDMHWKVAVKREKSGIKRNEDISKDVIYGFIRARTQKKAWLKDVGSGKILAFYTHKSFSFFIPLKAQFL